MLDDITVDLVYFNDDIAAGGNFAAFEQPRIFDLRASLGPLENALSRKRAANASRTQLHAVGEQANVSLKRWPSSVNSVAAPPALPTSSRYGHQHQLGSRLTVAEIEVTYDRTVNAAYVYLTEPRSRATSARMYACDPVGVDGMINLDFDEQGRLIGVEVLAASSKLPEYLLQSAERLDTEGA
ncbi:DUF2283 domain-containing protein [Streptomyces sp. NPDC048324]|uniref:DUF2283 domain-containing protein n=1 Tax=Streptomyces sp. NPDC048324 TaxID=3157205 RepID=UPI0034495D7F